MFPQDINIPIAIANNNEEGVDDAIDWCLQHLGEGETLTIWTHLKSNLRHNEVLEELVDNYSDTAHTTARGQSPVLNTGVVLMAWADVSDIAELLKRGRNRITALCVISWNEHDLAPWVAIQKPEILGDTSNWNEDSYTLNPVVEEELESLTRIINHNNTISGGYEKDRVVSLLLALNELSALPKGRTLKGWVVAHGWTGKNPGRLEKYADDILNGKRPRTRNSLKREYVASLRERLSKHS